MNPERCGVSKPGRCGRFKTVHRIAAHPDRRGYLQVTLYIGPGGPKKRFAVHDLVARAFHGPRPIGTVVCHRNDDPGDARPENLCYGTQKENVQQALSRGRMIHGDRSHLAKVTDRECLQMLALLRKGQTVIEVAALFGVSCSHVYMLRRGLFRKHLFAA
jgi:RNA:NAD 2'-phosphotransferase (TPT1/KptA family)